MSTPGLTSFRTSDVPDPCRLVGWEEHNARSLVGLRARPVGGRPFEGTEINLRLSRLHLAKVTGSPHVVERDHRQIATTPADGVVVYFALAGTGVLHHRDGPRTVGPGQALVLDADQPFERGFAHGLTELVLKAPRALVRGSTRPRVFSFRDDDHARALVTAVAGALGGRPTDWDALESTAIALLRTVLDAGASDESTLAAAHAHIAAHLHEDLSASRIAAAIGYSERHLSRLFAASGQSVPQAVLAARLDAARRALTHSRSPLAEIAAQHGFASQAHFSRSYRARFGTTPSQDRAR